MSKESSISYPGGPVRPVADVIQVTQDMVRIPSDKGTRNIGVYAKDFATRHGLKIATIPTYLGNGRVDRNNPSFLVGATVAELPPVLFGSHIDTFGVGDLEKWKFDPHGGTIFEGKMFGRGTSDSKGSAAAQLVAVAERRKGAVVLTSREETDLGGAKSAAEYLKKLPGRTLYVVDGGTDEEYAFGTRGVLEASMHLRGRTQHTGRPIDFKDVTELRDEIVGEIRGRVDAMPVDPQMGRTRFRRTADASGLIQTDGKYEPKVNNVPDGASALMTFRLTRAEVEPGQPLNSEWLTQVIADIIAQQNPKDELSLEKYNELLYVPGFLSDPEKVRWIADVAGAMTAKELVEWKYDERGLSEANHIMQAFPDAGLAIVGPGKQGTFHLPDEFIVVESLQQYTDVYGEILEQAA